jgi:hypothetical protein
VATLEQAIGYQLSTDHTPDELNTSMSDDVISAELSDAQGHTR